MKNLKEAREKGKLEDFIKEHEADPPGDLDRMNELMKRPIRESGKAVRRASSQDASDD